MAPCPTEPGLVEVCTPLGRAVWPWHFSVKLFLLTLNDFSLMCACSLVSNSLRPYRLHPTKLFCPWNFPGKNIRVGCHFLLQGIFLTEESNPSLLRLLHWQVDSLPLKHLGNPFLLQTLLTNSEMSCFQSESNWDCWIHQHCSLYTHVCMHTFVHTPLSWAISRACPYFLNVPLHIKWL